MPHEPGHVFDPYNLSPEEEKARRLLRQAEDALAPAAMRGQLGERGPLQEFLIEQADEIKNITGAKRARITDPDAFGAFLAGRSDEFEEFTGRPSPMRQAMLAEEGALSPTGMPERPGERGLSTGEKIELGAFAASPIAFGMAPFFAAEVGAELASEAVKRSPLPTPANTALEGLLAAAAFKRGRLTPKSAGLGFFGGAGIGGVGEALGVGEQTEQLGAFLSGGLTGDAVTGFGFRAPTLFAGGGRTADPTGVRLPSGRVSDPSATVAAVRNLPQRFEQFAADVGQTGVGNVLQPTPPVRQAARAADDVTGGGLNARIRSREAERVARTADAEQDFIPFHGDQIVDRGPQDLNTGSGRLTASRQALDRGNSAGAAVLKAQEDVISNFTDRGDPRAVFLRGGMGKEFGDIYAREVARLDALDLPTDVAARARVIANEPGAVSADEFMRAINGQTELAPRPQRGPNPDVQSVIGEIPPSPATPDVPPVRAADEVAGGLPRHSDVVQEHSSSSDFISAVENPREVGPLAPGIHVAGPNVYRVDAAGNAVRDRSIKSGFNYDTHEFTFALRNVDPVPANISGKIEGTQVVDVAGKPLACSTEHEGISRSINFALIVEPISGAMLML